MISAKRFTPSSLSPPGAFNKATNSFTVLPILFATYLDTVSKTSTESVIGAASSRAFLISEFMKSYCTMSGLVSASISVKGFNNPPKNTSATWTGSDLGSMVF